MSSTKCDVKKMQCCACGEVELLVGADGSVFDPLVGVAGGALANGRPLCFRCIDSISQEVLRRGVRLRFLEPIALPNGDILYLRLPPVSERTEVERAELQRLGILEVLAGYQRGDPAAEARIATDEFDHLPAIAPRPATPDEVAEEAERAKKMPKSPRSKGA